MSSLRTGEGYLQINHQDSPGLTDEQIIRFDAAIPPGMGTTNFESAILTCNHCQTMLILNPMRTRDRAYCPNCDHYICDACNVERLQIGCKTFKQRIDEHIEEVLKTIQIKEI